MFSSRIMKPFSSQADAAMGKTWKEERDAQAVKVTLLNQSLQDTKTFPQFARLPPELREQIWEECLIRERMISINLVEHHGSPRLYTAIPKEEKVISKLFRINTESRSCALRFYRVQMPCRYRRVGGMSEEGILYLNPDIDVFNIHAGTWKAFALFANEVWARDKEHFGLANLALEWDSTFLDDQEPQTSPLLCQTLSRLRKVVFILPDAGISSTLQFRHGLFSHGRHHIPVWTPSPYFDTMSKDPRLFEGHDPNIMFYHSGKTTTYKRWFNKIAQCGTQHHPDFQYQIMLCRERNERRQGDLWKTINRGQAIELSSKDHEWRNWVANEECGEFKLSGNGPQEIMEIKPPLVFGFWLFNIQPDELVRLANRKLVRLKPQLCLSHLPG
ncbi:hypothetical protein FHETE_7743 [Fusarium heterosporum]|uniref:2EXR domain-containing protein n=1 Tax=Fusarium heterosporum TaxID=42747 RepID=A0A8H5T5D5_FUSHE|nr:hypothetical protein FHETE_7743 [Fusarium heterosporum]